MRGFWYPGTIGDDGECATIGRTGACTDRSGGCQCRSAIGPRVRSLTMEHLLHFEADLALQLERLFPGWRSIEVLGPPGAGKSTVCEDIVAGVAGDVVSPRTGLRDYLDRCLLPRCNSSGVGSFGVAADAAPGKSREREEWLSRMQRELTGAERSFILSVQEFALRSGKIDDRSQYALTWFVQHFMICADALKSNRRALADEGPIKMLHLLLHWTVRSPREPSIVSELQRLIALYPYERNLLVVTASPQICFERQRNRGRFNAANLHEQVVRHDAAEVIWTLCRDAGWTIAVLDNSAHRDELAGRRRA